MRGNLDIHGGRIKEPCLTNRKKTHLGEYSSDWKIPQEKLEIKRNLTKPWAKRPACLETTFPNPNKK